MEKQYCGQSGSCQDTKETEKVYLPGLQSIKQYTENTVILADVLKKSV